MVTAATAMAAEATIQLKAAWSPLVSESELPRSAAPSPGFNLSPQVRHLKPGLRARARRAHHLGGFGSLGFRERAAARGTRSGSNRRPLRTPGTCSGTQGRPADLGRGRARAAEQNEAALQATPGLDARHLERGPLTHDRFRKNAGSPRFDVPQEAPGSEEQPRMQVRSAHRAIRGCPKLPPLGHGSR